MLIMCCIEGLAGNTCLGESDLKTHSSGDVRETDSAETVESSRWKGKGELGVIGIAMIREAM